MLYLATASTQRVREAMRNGMLGQVIGPNAGNKLLDGVSWMIDNGCFNAQWDEQRWLAKLTRYADRPHCLFAVVPDVVCDAAATDERWRHYSPVVRSLGYRCAYVTQNGCTKVPDDADVVFTGGDNEWKLSPQAQRLALDCGRWTHMGRVNTLQRLRFAAAHHYDSVDGTFIAFAPDENLPKLLSNVIAAHHPRLWEVV